MSKEDLIMAFSDKVSLVKEDSEEQGLVSEMWLSSKIFYRLAILEDFRMVMVELEGEWEEVSEQD